MKVFLLFIWLFTCAATITGQGFLCYVCDGEGCDQPTEVAYCGPPTGTESPATTDSSSESPVSTDSSPAVTDSSSESPISTDSSPSVTASSSESPTPTDSSSAVTESSSSSPTPNESSSAPTEAGSSSPTPNESSSAPTEASSSSPTPNESSSAPTEASSSSPTPNESSSAPTEASSSSPTPNESSSAPTEASSTSAPEDALDSNVRVEALRQKRSAATALIRNYRSISRAAGDGYACYSIRIQDDDDKSHFQRGCVVIPEEKDGCEAVQDQINVSEDKLSDCKVCQRDRCNGSAAVNVSLFVLLAAVILKCVM